ncbi:hypothetical protein ACFXJ8_42385 [Nonomuraea sp. NPDC059194]
MRDVERASELYAGEGEWQAGMAPFTVPEGPVCRFCALGEAQ